MSRKKLKKLQIDMRDAAVIESQIADLAEQYETGWIPDYENADIGTAIARIYAKGIEENIGRVNRILDRYHTEFVNMYDISLLAAKPSSAIVVMQMVSDTLPGTPVPKGTQLIAQTGEEPYVFETDHSLYVSSSRLVNAFLSDGAKGSVIPVMGRFIGAALPGEKPAPQLDETDMDEVDLSSYEDTSEIVIEEMQPFSLFGDARGIEKNAVVFTHSTVFDTGRDDIFVRIEGNPELVNEIDKGIFEFWYHNEKEGLCRMDRTYLLPDGETFVLNKDQDAGFHNLVLLAKNPVEASKKVQRISFSSKGEAINAETVSSGATDFDVEKFAPFTDTLSLYSECYICHDRYFGKAGAHVRITFDLLFDEHRISLTEQEEQENLKIIKRRPTSAQEEVYTDCYTQEIAVEYFNGIGWKKLTLSEDPRMMFYEAKAKQVDLEFICPDDWEETTNGSYDGRAIRITLLKADNCYMRPAVHHYPIIKGLKISYSYEKTYVDADSAKIYFDTKAFSITDRLKDEKGYTLFRKSIYDEDALYLGFSRNIDNGPASILFQLEDGVRFTGLKCHFEYLGYDGWRSLKVLDYTQDFTHSGVVMFMPPSDMKRQELVGSPCYWLRVLRVKKNIGDKSALQLPRVENIVLNAVQVSNIETLPEVPIYIDEAFPNMRFALGASNVLDASVYVNEMGKYSLETMRELSEADAAKYQIEEDGQGNVVAFYVLWSETERFETSTDKRVYMLDRLSNELIFGDGVHTWMPRVTDDTAVRFCVRCCNGQAGNVPANTIVEPLGVLNYIGSITNPVKAYGGSNIETLDNALERASGILSSRNRLVTVDDYKRAILSYSDTIDQVAGVSGLTIDGRQEPSEITFLLLMKDFKEGSYSFHRIVGGLKKELLKHCELTVVPEKLHIAEPIYVSISVSVWVNVVSIDDSFEIQGLLSSCLEEYLDPVSDGSGGGWKIGTIPKKPQILMRLGVLKSRAIIKKSVMIARYTDAHGEHETDLSDLKVTPFMVCRNGEHYVHIIY